VTALRIVFAGTPEFSVPALEAIVASRHRVVACYTQPDRPAGRGRELTASPVKQCALQHALPLEQPPTLRTADAAATLAGYAPDVMVVVAYGLLLPQSVLDVPVHGCLNIHASLLPRWRGAAPIQRALEAGDTATGVSIMRMEAGLDTGPVMLTSTVRIGADDTAATLHDRLARSGATLIVAALERIAAGSAAYTPQDTTQVTYAKKLDKREAEIDWSAPAAVIERRVRAFVPWPVAQTRCDGAVLRIWRAHAVDTDAAARPGTVLAADAAGIVVATGIGALVVDLAQLPGRKALPARELLNGLAVPAGTVLGAP
jgi:methionyl-tRNA formyltransferase